MVGMAVRCQQRSGNRESQIKVKPGTHFSMAQTSPPVGCPLLAVCLPCAPVPLRPRKSRSKVKWTAKQRLVWEGWVAEDKVLDPQDYPIELWTSHVGCNRIMGRCIQLTLNDVQYSNFDRPHLDIRIVLETG